MELNNIGYKGFACPQEPFNEEFLRILATGYAHAVCRTFLQQFGDDLNIKHNGLTSFIEAWIEDTTTFDDVWNPAFGEVRQALSDVSHSDYVRAAVTLALHLQYCGQFGAWEAELTSPTRLQWGRWLLPIADKLVVTSQKHQVVIELTYLGLSNRLTFERYDGVWEGEGAEALPHTCKGIENLTLLLPDALTHASYDDVRPDFADKIPVKSTLMVCEDAGKILHNHAETYFRWVERVVRAIVPLRTKKNVFSSSSSYNSPGVISISFPSPSLRVSEALVHEGSHQYFYLLSHLGDFEDGTDTTLYYSPIRQEGRPIRNILLAYHAFANVFLFHRLCREKNVPESKDARQREKTLFPQLKQLESALLTTRALTPLGKAIWEPISAQIHSNVSY